MPQAGDIFAPSAIPRRVGLTQGIADLTATSGTTEKSVDAVTVSVVAGNTYTIRYLFHYTGTVLNDTFLMRIRQGGLAGVQLTYSMADVTATSGGALTRYAEVDWVAASTGSQTFTTTIQRAGLATGTATVKGAASQPRKLEVRFEE